mgnify:CR=1 FL=1
MRHQITQWGHEAWVDPDGVHFSDYGSLEELARTAPHDCDVPGCPGPLNQRKLERYQELLAALTKIATEPEGAYHRDRNEYLQNVIAWCQETARAAIAKVTSGAHGPGCDCPRANCTLARLTPIDDPEIHEALKDVGLS